MLLKSDTAYSAVTRPLNQMYWLVTKEVKGNTPCQAVSYKTHKLYFFFFKRSGFDNTLKPLTRYNLCKQCMELLNHTE